MGKLFHQCKTTWLLTQHKKKNISLKQLERSFKIQNNSNYLRFEKAQKKERG